jgi:hypothetical protein
MTDKSHPIGSPAKPTPLSPLALKLRHGFWIALGLLVALNVFVRPHHPHFGLEAIPGFWAFFGLAIAVLLARVAKGAAHTFLGKDEDFYEQKTQGTDGGPYN